MVCLIAPERDRREGSVPKHSDLLRQDTAALKAKINIKSKIPPRNRAGIGTKTSDLIEEIADRAVPRDSPGEGGPKQK